MRGFVSRAWKGEGVEPSCVGCGGDSVSVGGVVRAEREAAGRAIRCAAGVSIASCATR